MKTPTPNHRASRPVIRPTVQVALLLAVVLVTSRFAYAGSATWNQNPTNGDWFTSANWTPETVPNGKADTATFDASNVTAVTCRKRTQLAGITFDPGASPYTITIMRESS